MGLIAHLFHETTINRQILRFTLEKVCSFVRFCTTPPLRFTLTPPLAPGRRRGQQRPPSRSPARPIHEPTRTRRGSVPARSPQTAPSATRPNAPPSGRP